MNDFKKAISEAQAEKESKEKKKEQEATEHKAQLEKWIAEVRSWEKEVYYPILKDVDAAIKDIGGWTQSVDTQTGVYNVTVQARGKGQKIILRIARDGTLGTVTDGGHGGDELGKISDSGTTKRFRDLLVGAVKKAAS
jgi:hypothetical protein